MDGDLDRYLKSDVLQLYVFDYKEEQMDEYVGKARVPLLPLAQDEEINGERHSSGLRSACSQTDFSSSLKSLNYSSVQ